jgi:2'-5' RNA ligase
VASLRCFAAVGLPSAVREEIAAFVARLHAGCPGMKWSDPAGLHLTLKFFGSVDETRLPALSEALARAASAAAPFRARLSGAGAFPDARKPQVLWTGAAEGGPAFLRLARAVEEETEAIGFEPEPRPFRPHVTLGRAKEGTDKLRTGETLQTAVFESSSWSVEGLRLYRSRPGPSGSVYECLQEIPFLAY